MQNITKIFLPQNNLPIELPEQHHAQIIWGNPNWENAGIFQNGPQG